MAANKTQPTDMDPQEFIARFDPLRRNEASRLLELFEDVTGFPAVMWGPSIIGFGRYHYRYASGREGDFLATGFSPRKSAISVYIMPGYADYSDILKDLGKHKTGKSCLYIKRLTDVDLDVLAKLIRVGLNDLDEIWPISAR